MTPLQNPDRPSEPGSLPNSSTSEAPPPPPPTGPLIGKSTFVWTLSGLAFTTGLTIALIPALRRNRRRQVQAQVKSLTSTNRYHRGGGVRGEGSGNGNGFAGGSSASAGVGGGAGGSTTGANEPGKGKKNVGVLDGLIGPTMTMTRSSSEIKIPGSSTSTSISTGNSTYRGKTSDGIVSRSASGSGSASALSSGRGGSLVSPSILSSLPALGTGVLSSEGTSSTPSGGTVGSSSTANTRTANTPDLVVDPPTPTSNPNSEPQIKYFSIHPSDPFSDEEDEFGFPRHDPDVNGNASHNDTRDHQGGGLGEGEETDDPISPFFALKAFSIATGLVVGSALAGVGLIGWGFGVRNMEEFTAEMRRLTARKLPSMGENIFKAIPEGGEQDLRDDPLITGEAASATSATSTSTSTTRARNNKITFDTLRQPPPSRPRTPEDEEEETIVSGWWREVVEGAEEERRARVTGGGSRER